MIQWIFHNFNFHVQCTNALSIPVALLEEVQVVQWNHSIFNAWFTLKKIGTNLTKSQLLYGRFFARQWCFWLSWPHCGGRLVSKQLKSSRCPLSTSRLSVMRSKWCRMDQSDLSLDGRSDHIWLQRCPTAHNRQSNPSDREDSQPGRVRVRDSNELRIPAITALTTFAHYCVCALSRR